MCLDILEANMQCNPLRYLCFPLATYHIRVPLKMNELLIDFM